MARIPVVDDDPAFTKLVQLLLEAIGHEVLVASDGISAAWEQPQYFSAELRTALQSLR